ncbi:F-box protein [Apiospora hydei]|uniref:F-box protein n=1 Tax=Apiospora hydei TaxID=1337664 RepID=A0ABR1XC30_9PEZI
MVPASTNIPDIARPEPCRFQGSIKPAPVPYQAAMEGSDLSQRRSSSDKSSGRSSFSSVRENDSDLAQTFTSTKVSSYSQPAEAAVVEDDDPTTHPPPPPHCCCLEDRVVRSPASNKPTPSKLPGRPTAGQAPIERLPLELLGPIIDLLVLDVPPNGISARNVDLMSLLLTSKTLHTATLHALYRNITIPHSRIFRKFLAHCLEFTPYLREFLAQEHIDDEIDENVLRKLFLDLPRLQAVDFTGCSSGNFKAAMSAIPKFEWPVSLAISRLSLHKCINLPSAVFETLMPTLGNLTHLDVAGTRITDEALMSIPHTARITHLNLAKCALLSAEVVIEFLATHPAVNGSLVFLSVASDARSHQLFDVEDVTRLLPALPPTLRSLSLKGSKMDDSHVNLLRPLTKHLEELALGRGLRLIDIDRLFVPDEDDDDVQMQLDWVPHTLKYLDLSDYSAAELDFSTLFSNSMSIMKKFSAPLEVVEVTDNLYSRLSKSPALQRLGWMVTEFGSRAWMVRRHSPEDGPRDSGLRSWKLGASFWGMRKIPMANAEVGGMYGSYMFKRKL